MAGKKGEIDRGNDEREKVGKIGNYMENLMEKIILYNVQHKGISSY